MAHASVERREVSLLEPLVNWKYALVTLERPAALQSGIKLPDRARGGELLCGDYSEGKSSEVQQGMIDRFRKASRGGYGVDEELASQG